MIESLFANRTIAIATMHGKEQVIAPILEQNLNLAWTVPTIDTDALGTFSGEVNRIHSPIETARKKCELAMKVSGCDLAIASEGSFGAHPSIPFVPADDEFVLLIDAKNNFEVFGRELTTETNFSGSFIGSLDEAMNFAEQVSFPSHGLIIRELDVLPPLHKGVRDQDLYAQAISDLLRTKNRAWIETDMRAMHNPTRMKAITKATQQLLDKIDNACPSCNYPGYAISNAVDGLPCGQCHRPTKSTLAHVLSCVKCSHTEQKKYPHGISQEDPMYCDFCNP